MQDTSPTESRDAIPVWPDRIVHDKPLEPSSLDQHPFMARAQSFSLSVNVNPNLASSSDIPLDATVTPSNPPLEKQPQQQPNANVYSNLLNRIRDHLYASANNVLDASNFRDSPHPHYQQLQSQSHDRSHSSAATSPISSAPSTSSDIILKLQEYSFILARGLETVEGIDLFLRVLNTFARALASGFIALADIEDEEDRVWSGVLEVATGSGTLAAKSSVASILRWFRVQNAFFGWWRLWCWWTHATAAAAAIAESSSSSPSSSADAALSSFTSNQSPNNTSNNIAWFAVAAGFNGGEDRRKLALKFLRIWFTFCTGREMIRVFYGLRKALDLYTKSYKKRLVETTSQQSSILIPPPPPDSDITLAHPTTSTSPLLPHYNHQHSRQSRMQSVNSCTNTNPIQQTTTISTTIHTRTTSTENKPFQNNAQQRSSPSRTRSLYSNTSRGGAAGIDSTEEETDYGGGRSRDGSNSCGDVSAASGDESDDELVRQRRRRREKRRQLQQQQQQQQHDAFAEAKISGGEEEERKGRSDLIGGGGSGSGGRGKKPTGVSGGRSSSRRRPLSLDKKIAGSSAVAVTEDVDSSLEVMGYPVPLGSSSASGKASAILDLSTSLGDGEGISQQTQNLSLSLATMTTTATGEGSSGSNSKSFTRPSTYSLPHNDSVASFTSSVLSHYVKPQSLFLSRSTTPPTSIERRTPPPTTTAPSAASPYSSTTNLQEPSDKLSLALKTWRSILHLLLHVPLQITYILARTRIIGFNPSKRLSSFHTKATYSVLRTRQLKQWINVVWTLVIFADAGVWVRKLAKIVRALVVVRRQVVLSGRGNVGRKSVTGGGGVSGSCSNGGGGLNTAVAAGLGYGVEDFIADLASKGAGAFVNLFDAMQKRTFSVSSTTAVPRVVGDHEGRSGGGTSPYGNGVTPSFLEKSDLSHHLPPASMEHKMLLSELEGLKYDMRIACLALVSIVGDLPQALGGTFRRSSALTETGFKMAVVAKDTIGSAAIMDAEDNALFPSWVVGLSGALASLAAWRLRWKSNVTVDSL
ncbi:UNVERIFIED_CONTAM: hypothetical protein HDU68_007179 [Siphonaria sp. JEL0065]|nr:hypothetical protein HDU68_007179 [Siphonaria sp. JEL0065]